MNKQIHIIGGGTTFYIRPHLALCAPAYGKTARFLYDYCLDKSQLPSHLHLTKMAGGDNLETNQDISDLLDKLIQDPSPKIIFMPVALCDYDITDLAGEGAPRLSVGKNFSRLKTSNGNITMRGVPADKLIRKIRKTRKDIFLVGFKTTHRSSENEMFESGASLLKKNSCNLVLVNDIFHKTNIIVTPELARYGTGLCREEILQELVKMAINRSQGTFHRTDVLPDRPLIPFSQAPETLRKVLSHCLDKGAYKPFNNVTVGHFGYKVTNDTLISSRRKQNYNLPGGTDLVKVVFEKDKQIAYGAKPSAGVRSQFLLLQSFPQYNCVVHFHCLLKENSQLKPQSQKEFECGSLECGKNTVAGITEFDGFAAVMLDKHGPNIIFNESTNPQKIIDFIEENFDLSKSAN